MKPTRRFYYSLLLTTLMLVAACTTVAVTGRRQVNLIPSSTMLSMSSGEYRNFLSQAKLSTNREQTEMVKRCGARIQAQVEAYFRENGMADRLNDFAWEFNLVDSPEVNAWCMPGGKVVFYTGILPITKDEEGLAVVMGHEIAHAIAEHGSERMSQGLLTNLGGMAIAQALKDKPQQTQQLFMAAFGLGAQFGLLLPFSRLHESEADKLGLIFMAKAGYNPESAVAFWERMREMKGGQAPPEFMSTHPSDETRIRDLKAQMPEALRVYKPRQ
ncbi:MAG: M48 family metallopeptidase [Chloroherpetonaceae bacterium]|nr:M48 family metallopeptidase [Chloroherpetonaceae bacterium]